MSAIQATEITRKFKYNGITLDCPGLEFSPAEVKDIYTNAYPELTNAVIEGPIQTGDKLVYEFRRAVGTKG